MNDLKKKWWVVDGDDACKDEVSQLNQNISIKPDMLFTKTLNSLNHCCCQRSFLDIPCLQFIFFMLFCSYFFAFQGGGGDQMSVAALAGLFMMLIGGMVRQSSR